MTYHKFTGDEIVAIAHELVDRSLQLCGPVLVRLNLEHGEERQAPDLHRLATMLATPIVYLEPLLTDSDNVKKTKTYHSQMRLDVRCVVAVESAEDRLVLLVVLREGIQECVLRERLLFGEGCGIDTYFAGEDLDGKLDIHCVSHLRVHGEAHVLLRLELAHAVVWRPSHRMMLSFVEEKPVLHFREHSLPQLELVDSEHGACTIILLVVLAKGS